MKFKNEVKALLRGEEWGRLTDLAADHGGKTANILISLVAEPDETTRWRAIRGLGLLTARLHALDPERARRVLRQLIWNLNEESGGVGWGLPEAFGEILARQEDLAREYGCILAGYLLEARVFLEPEELQTGVVWALGRMRDFPADTKARIIGKLIGLLRHPNPALKGTAIWALGELEARQAGPLLGDLPADQRMISLMVNGSLVPISIDGLVRQVKNKLKQPNGKEVASVNDWKCSKCGYTLKADTPPETCPQCKEKCEFLNVTCYIPECGFTGSDQRLK